MAAISAQLKRAFITWLQAKVADGTHPTLEKAIKSFIVDRVESISTGLIETSSSGSGYTGSFATPAPNILAGFSVVEVAAMAQELLEVYKTAKDDLTQIAYYGLTPLQIRLNGWPSPLPAPTTTLPLADESVEDDALADWMCVLLPTIRQHTNDYSRARYLNGGAVV